jgi:hypothetical protein
MRIWKFFFQKRNGFERKPVRQDLLGIERVEAIQHFNLNESKNFCWFWAEVLVEEE